jgi:hypothetical protein
MNSSITTPLPAKDGGAKKLARPLMYAVVVALVALTGFWTVTSGPSYIVPPIDPNTPTAALSSHGWAASVTGVSEKSGALHVDLAIINESGDWSAMNVAQSKASVVDSAGKSTSCGTVFVGTSTFVNNGGWYIPPGFVIKGYQTGTVAEPKTQDIYVECDGVSQSSAARLKVDYSFITGPFNYYTPSQYFGKTFDLDLTKIVDQKFPVADVAEDLIIQPNTDIPAINHISVLLSDAKRTDTGIVLTWKATNPGDYPLSLAIGLPPVVGSDGILYGVYQSPHLDKSPIIPSKGDVTWTTKVAVPATATGLYVLVPVTTRQDKYFVDHVIDITGA